jgi:hypothetical protein
MKKYIVLTERYCSDLEKRVNSKINEGYFPIGGISTCGDSSERYYFQAMIYVGEEK